jgi:hypothetical protein
MPVVVQVPTIPTSSRKVNTYSVPPLANQVQLQSTSKFQANGGGKVHSFPVQKPNTSSIRMRMFLDTSNHNTFNLSPNTALQQSSHVLAAPQVVMPAASSFLTPNTITQNHNPKSNGCVIVPQASQLPSQNNGYPICQTATRSQSRQECRIPGCNQPVYVDNDGPSEYCSMRHRE